MSCLNMIVSLIPHLKKNTYICCLDPKSPKPIEDVLRSFKTVLSWNTSCRLIFKNANQFQSGPEWQLIKFSFSQRILLPFRFDVSSVSHSIKSWRGTLGVPNLSAEDEDEDAQCAISNSFLAKVHAEAALMYYITTFQVRLYSLM